MGARMMNPDAGHVHDGTGKTLGVRRRTFLGQGLLLMLAGFGRRLWAQALRYRPLARPVLAPLADLSTPGRVRRFTADGVTLASATTPNQPIRINGLITRVAEGDDQPEQFSAVCARCPHEGCEVDFVPDPESLPPEVLYEIGHPVNESVYVCPCHNGTFSVWNGERLAGPAPRGLYRFRVTNVTETTVEIGEVEEDVLIFV
jgi:Rieske Fe-S protein